MLLGLPALRLRGDYLALVTLGFGEVVRIAIKNLNAITRGADGLSPIPAPVVPGVPLYEHHSVPGVTQPGTVQWLNPDAFVSTVDPSTGTCLGGDSPKNCQFGNLGRNALRGPNFTWSDFYLTKSFPLTERLKMRFDTQFFNVFNHTNFVGFSGTYGNGATAGAGFGAPLVGITNQLPARSLQFSVKVGF